MEARPSKRRKTPAGKKAKPKPAVKKKTSPNPADSPTKQVSDTLQEAGTDTQATQAQKKKTKKKKKKQKPKQKQQEKGKEVPQAPKEVGEPVPVVDGEQVGEEKGTEDQGALSHRERKRKISAINQELKKLAQGKELGKALATFKRAKKQGAELTVHTYTNIINACVRCGEVARASELLREMTDKGIRPNEVTYTAYIKGLMQEGEMALAWSAMAGMIKRKSTPNTRTLDTVLRSCVKWGSWPMALRTFALFQKLKVAPSVSTYESLIKVLCISLRLPQAWKVVAEMQGKDMLWDSPVLAHVATAAALSGNHEEASKALTMCRLLMGKDTAAAVPRYKLKSMSKQERSLAMFKDHRHKETKRRCDLVEDYLTSATPKLRSFEVGVHQKGLHWLPSHTYTQTKTQAQTQPQTKQAKGEEGEEEEAGPQRHTFEKGEGVRGKAGLQKASKPPTNSLEECFENGNKICVEFCSGSGEWVVQRARQDPDTNWVACEIRTDRVFNVWTQMQLRHVSNLLVLAGDAHKAVSDFLPAASVEEAFVNYPEPPGWEGSKRRLLTVDFLSGVWYALRMGGHFCLMTDKQSVCQKTAEELSAMDGWTSALDEGEAMSSQPPPGYGSSFFDRLWTNGERKKRYWLRYKKIAWV